MPRVNRISKLEWKTSWDLIKRIGYPLLQITASDFNLYLPTYMAWMARWLWLEATFFQMQDAQIYGVQRKLVLIQSIDKLSSTDCTI